jgi:peroxiredoxin Q/BCP
MAMPQVGETAPDFSLTAHDGAKLTLTGYRGRRVVLFFFVKANTSG